MKGYCASLATYFTGYPLTDRFALAAEAGFPAVELAVPYFVSATELAACRESAGLPVILFTAPLGDFLEGGEGIGATPGKEAEFRDSVSVALEYAEALAADYVQFVAGRCANESDRDRYVETYRQNLSYAEEAFAGTDTRLLLEPINSMKFEHYLIDTPGRARELELDLPLIFDTVHLAVMGLDPMEEWRVNADDYGHVQMADLPDRGFPGTGMLRFSELVKSIESSNYDGWIGAECWVDNLDNSSLANFRSALASV